ncbi:MAG: hypothetical protein H7Z43_08205 [Clostridia bacterium]|nr:hypothetical protein [Deltaproteobacteria bacterium]
MNLVVVGHAACDVIVRKNDAPATPVLGGSATYIGLAAATLCAHVNVVTVAPKD